MQCLDDSLGTWVLDQGCWGSSIMSLPFLGSTISTVPLVLVKSKAGPGTYVGLCPDPGCSPPHSPEARDMVW